MKLNNKGFAFSTMLYGTLALLTLILYVVLDVSKNSYDETYYYGDEIKIELNRCMKPELELEDCYSSGNPHCDNQLKQYHNCLGIADDTTEPAHKILSRQLSDNDISIPGLVIETDSVGTPVQYYFRGTTVNNYVKYLNKTFRIVSIEKDGFIKLIETDYEFEHMWHSGGIGGLIWKNSALNGYLNSSYLDHLTSIMSGFTAEQSSWKATILYPSSTTPTPSFSLATLARQTNDQGSAIVNYSSAGTLSIEDYMKSSTNCNANNINILTATGCNGWLSEYRGWTSNISAEAVGYVENGEVVQDPSSSGSLLSTSYVYYFDGGATGTKGVKVIPCGETRPTHGVFYVNRNAYISGGAGTAANPYILTLQ